MAGLSLAPLTSGLPNTPLWVNLEEASPSREEVGGRCLCPDLGTAPESLGSSRQGLVWGFPYPQGPVPVSSCLLHAGASDVPQATANKTQSGRDGPGLRPAL